MTILEQIESIEKIRERLASVIPDSPIFHGCRIYSQCDEDGIIRHILNTMSQKINLTRTFIEFGAGDGLQNNTAALLLEGFRGCWLDVRQAVMDNVGAFADSAKFKLLRVANVFLTLENTAAIVEDFLNFLGTENVDFLSMDLGGNDYDFMKAILSEVKPKLICVEYNAKFPPPLDLHISYNANSRWAGDDYYGASLQAYVNLFREYTLVCCNISGVNAFFARNDLASLFPGHAPATLYQPPPL